MFENNKDFYPTPPSLIDKMLSKVDFRCVTDVLEPSAGKADLADAIVDKIINAQYRSYNKYETQREIDERKTKAMKKIECIEVDDNLKYILQGKGYKVIHDDFLTYNGMKRYSTIVANFPFSEGDKHLMKALDILESNSGQLVCIINENTLKNAYSNNRKVLIQRLEDLNAEIEYLESEFVEAERSTSVAIALINVKVENTKIKESIIIENLKQEELYRKENDYTQNNIVNGDFIYGIVEQYEFEVKTGIALINEYFRIKPNLLKDFKENSKCSILRLCINNKDGMNQYKDESQIEMINEYIKQVRYKYWNTLFNSKQFTSMLTSNLQKDLFNMIDKLVDYDFSIYNIKEIKMQMSNNVIKGVEDTILALFDEFSAKHSYEDFSKNIHMFNGWKSNSCYKINKRIVSMINGYYDIQCSWGRYSPTRVINRIEDIEKVFNYLDGGRTEEIDLSEALKEAEKNNKTTNVETKFLKLTFYKKGTCHIVFKDEELLKKFNIFGCQKRNFLPPSYGKKKYTDMTKEEQDVIDSFEGKESYNKTMNNLDYYLYNPSKILMLQG